MIIYKITNKINGKCYIGQTTLSLALRWKQHCQSRRKRACPGIQAAIKKYGVENFQLEELERCESVETLNEREIFWIKKFNSYGSDGYNLTSGGNNYSPSEETKRKISTTLKGRPSKGRKFKKGHCSWNTGRAWTESEKRKLKEAHLNQIPWCLGKKLSVEHRQKLSNSKLGKPLLHLRKAIICLTNGITYSSLKEAAKELNLQTSKICLVLKGKRTHTGGFIFQYLK